jgi:hypothetical protein
LQVPTYSPGYRFKINEYLGGNSMNNDVGIEMHVIPQYRLFDILKHSGWVLLECREDCWAGSPDMISNSVFARKQGNTETAISAV